MLSSRTTTELSVAPKQTLLISSMPPCVWKEPELSIGSSCASRDLFGRYKCWLVKDKSPAHNVWKAVSKSIVKVLDDQFEHLDAGDSDLMFEMFMIGRKPTSSVPTILFSCESRSCRQKAISLVKKKSILAPYPGVKMAECSKMPKVLAQGEDSELLFLPSGVYLDGPLRTCGTSILISFGPKRPPRNATIGGIVCIEETLYGVTAGHAFTQTKELKDNESEEIEFSFFGGDDPFDSSDDEDESVEMTSQASISSGSSQSPDSKYFELGGQRRKSLASSFNSGSTERSRITTRSETQTGKSFDDTRERYGSLFAISDPDGSNDWALVKVEHPALLAFPRADKFMANNLNIGNKIVYPNAIATGSSDTDVLTCTGSGGVVQGRLSGTAAFKKAAGQKGFQELLAISLSVGSFRDGDCGSWVCDTRTGAVYGHVISGYPGTGSAYLAPADQIFKDMQQSLKKSVQLLTRSLAARNAALSIWGHIDTEKASPAEFTQRAISERRPMHIDESFKPRPLYVAHAEIEEVISSNLSQNAEARSGPAQTNEETISAIPDTGSLPSHPQHPFSKIPERKFRPLLPSRPPNFATPTNDPGYSSSNHPVTSALSPRVAPLLDNPTHEENLRESSSSSYFRAEVTHSKRAKGEQDNRSQSASPKVVRDQLTQKTLSDIAGEDSQPPAKREATYERRPSSSSKTKGARKVKRPPSAHAHKSSSTYNGPIGRVVPGNVVATTRWEAASPPHMIPQPIPFRPGAVSTIGNRPISYFPSTINSGYGTGPMIAQASAYGLQLQAHQTPPSYFSPNPTQYHSPHAAQNHPRPHEPYFRSQSIEELASAIQQYDGRPPLEARSLAARFTRPQQGSAGGKILDADGGYSSAGESSVHQQNLSAPARSNSAAGLKNQGMPSVIRRKSSWTKLDDRQAMPPPPGPEASRPNRYYDIQSPRRPEAKRRSASYDINQNMQTVRIETASTMTRRNRTNQRIYGQETSGEADSYAEKLWQATSYQEDVTGGPTIPLTADVLRRQQKREQERRAPSSRDTRSTRSSRRTRSRSRSASSASSMTSRDESDFKRSKTRTTRNRNDNDEDVTIKVTGNARVMVGGTQIDCGDGGGEIVINRMRSILNSTDRAEDRLNYDFPRQDNLRRRFERSTSTSTPGDGKSDLSMVSAASDETVVQAMRYPTTGLSSSSKTALGDQPKGSISQSKVKRRSPVPEPDSRAQSWKFDLGSDIGQASRCGTCMTNGQEVWVVPKKSCPICGTAC